VSDVSIVFILGPTASGKSNLAIAAAQRLGGEIINADSIQVYKSLDIGSAKPSKEELEMIPHHLIGHVPEGENYTAGRFRDDVLSVIKKRSAAGVKRFYIVGGSGFYIKALTKGLYQIPPVPQEIQVHVAKTDPKDLYEELQKVDPAAASRINPNDTYRIARAIEVFRATGTPFSEFKNKFSKVEFPYKYIKIGLKAEKEILKNRIAERAQKMLTAGLIAEVRALIKRGYKDWDALSSVGYKEVLTFLEGELSEDRLREDRLREDIIKNTMGLVKKQMTWFKKDIEMTWFDAFVGNEKIIQFIEEEL
jgi:tRNA dimethylallyltransferase